MIAALLLLAQAPGTAMAPAVGCSRVRVALPPALAGWGKPASGPTIGRVFTVTAAPAAAAQEKVDRPGGVAVARLHVATAGRYGVALDQAAWIDVRAAGTSLASVAHRHGPACSGIRKIVEFDVPSGDIEIVLSGLTGGSARILIAPSG